MSKLNLENPLRKKLVLLRQLIILVALGIGIFLIVRWWQKKDENSRFEIENSPIKVEMVKNIAQLASISYKDEVVVDTAELYGNEQEMLLGNLSKLADLENLKHGIKATNIKRRLTLIVKGEVLIGFDLKNKEFRIEEHDSIIQIFMPEPKIIDVLSTASSTRVFQENGVWNDYEITNLKNKARNKMRLNAEALNLRDKAKENAKRFLSQLIIKGNKKIEFIFIS